MTSLDPTHSDLPNLDGKKISQGSCAEEILWKFEVDGTRGRRFGLVVWSGGLTEETVLFLGKLKFVK